MFSTTITEVYPKWIESIKTSQCLKQGHMKTYITLLKRRKIQRTDNTLSTHDRHNGGYREIYPNCKMKT